MPEFRLAAVSRNGEPRPVLVVEDRAIDIQDALIAHGISAPNAQGRLDVLPILDDWGNWLPTLRRVAELGERGHSMSQARFLAPIRYPRKLLMAGANYSDHIEEMVRSAPQRIEAPTREAQPFFFMKPPTTSIIGPGDTVVLPKAVQHADWEAELVAVIGKPARKIKASDALAYVAGYTVMNDISARDQHRRPGWYGPFLFDWIRAKGWETFAPMGPSITPSEFVPNPHNLRVTCSVSGQLMQDGNTRNFIWNVNEMLEFLSDMFTLEPGDCISTGTPAGVGAPRGVFLKDGDVVVSQVEGVCRLETRIAREP